jgi:hypothetical protein
VRPAVRIVTAAVGLGATLFGGVALLVRQPAWEPLVWRGTARSEPDLLRRHVELLAGELAPPLGRPGLPQQAPDARGVPSVAADEKSDGLVKEQIAGRCGSRLTVPLVVSFDVP